MNALLKQHGNSRFDIIAFPCNQFGRQEPGANKTEILNGLKYVRPGNGYVPSFNMMAKIRVNGEREIQLYKFLKNACPSPRDAEFNTDALSWHKIKPDDISWNFEKFLINTDGIPVARFLPVIEPIRVFNLIYPFIGLSSISDRAFQDYLQKKCHNGEREYCRV